MYVMAEGDFWIVTQQELGGTRVVVGCHKVSGLVALGKWFGGTRSVVGWHMGSGWMLSG